MGATSSSHHCASRVVVDSYPIRLTAEQSVSAHGFAKAKTTLTWRDIQLQPGKLTFARCVNIGISVHKLYAMQPDLKEWIAHGGVTVLDCSAMRLWSPNPFLDFGCKIGDLILHRKHLPPEVLIRAGITLSDLCERHGLNGELMAMLHYSPEHWSQMGLAAVHLDMLSDTQWIRVFGDLTRSDVTARFVTK